MNCKSCRTELRITAVCPSPTCPNKALTYPVDALLAAHRRGFEEAKAMAEEAVLAKRLPYTRTSVDANVLTCAQRTAIDQAAAAIEAIQPKGD